MKLTIPEDLFERLQTRSAEEGISVELLVEQLLEQGLAAYRFATDEEVAEVSTRLLEQNAELYKRLAKGD
jgi:plasmid stability protein